MKWSWPHFFLISPFSHCERPASTRVNLDNAAIIRPVLILFIASAICGMRKIDWFVFISWSSYVRLNTLRRVQNESSISTLSDPLLTAVPGSLLVQTSQWNP